MPSSRLINITFELAQDPGVRFMATVFQQDSPGDLGDGVCCAMASIWIKAVIENRLDEFRAKVRRDNNSSQLAASSEFVVRQAEYRRLRDEFLRVSPVYHSARQLASDIRDQLVRNDSAELRQRWTRAIQEKNDTRFTREALRRFYGGGRVLMRPVTQAGFAAGEIVNRVEDIACQNGIYFFLVNISADGEGSHAVALVKDAAICRFFDATTGEWEVDRASFKTFFKNYMEKIYTITNLGLKPIFVFFGPPA